MGSSSLTAGTSGPPPRFLLPSPGIWLSLDTPPHTVQDEDDRCVPALHCHGDGRPSHWGQVSRDKERRGQVLPEEGVHSHLGLGLRVRLHLYWGGRQTVLLQSGISTSHQL